MMMDERIRALPAAAVCTSIESTAAPHFASRPPPTHSLDGQVVCDFVISNETMATAAGADVAVTTGRSGAQIDTSNLYKTRACTIALLVTNGEAALE